MTKESIEPFDWQRMFVGEHDPLFLGEIIFRTCLMYWYTLILLRVIGKRALGELTLLEYATVFVLGSAVGDPMFYPDVPLLYGMFVITTFVVLQRLSLGLSRKKHPIIKYIEGEPSLVIADGKVMATEIKNQGLSQEQIFMLLRENGIQNLSEVRRAYLEPTGEISVFTNLKNLDKPGSILPKIKK